jgi:hypothetical protein
VFAAPASAAFMIFTRAFAPTRAVDHTKRSAFTMARKWGRMYVQTLAKALRIIAKMSRNAVDSATARAGARSLGGISSDLAAGGCADARGEGDIKEPRFETYADFPKGVFDLFQILQSTRCFGCLTLLFGAIGCGELLDVVGHAHDSSSAFDSAIVKEEIESRIAG